MADTRSPWTLMKQSLHPASVRADENIAARRDLPQSSAIAPMSQEREAAAQEAFLKHIHENEARNAAEASKSQPPPSDGYKKYR